ncbi:MAG: hypothetical protein RMJ28_00890 [Nitrososphaerota archaeon]|nr:hypothetical protein [Candidatus Calditenuaceae archaeon]MDW8072788.1 hypothetical protein [Nitrososphaerota archaeon]
MLVITLYKAVPARTTKIVTVGGVLRREEMDLVMNPFDYKAIEAADYLKRAFGGKVIALTMGPDFKLKSIAASLYDTPVEGIDESYILSDRRMAGADTWATAYTVSLGVKKVVEAHLSAVDELISLIRGDADPERFAQKAKELYERNLIPNAVYSSLPTLKEATLAERLLKGEVDRGSALRLLEKVRHEVEKFIVIAGIKTSDGETGSTGPQVAEALTELLRRYIPSVTYVRELEADPEAGFIYVERKLGDLIQKLRVPLPCVISIATDYRPNPPLLKLKKRARMFNYAKKVTESVVLNADQIGAKPELIGLTGSPTIVGPGMDIGVPPVQKFVGKTLVLSTRVEEFELNGKKYGPFERLSKADDLPQEVLNYLRERGLVKVFELEDLVDELFGVRVSVAGEHRI